MSGFTDGFAPLLGSWIGESTLWLEPGTPARVSNSTLRAAEVAMGKFLSVDYTWSFDDRPQAGALLVGHDPKRALWQAAWVDSWHMGSVMMSCTGTSTSTIDVRGEYEVGDGSPNWGWRTALEIADGHLILRMWNIAPDGSEYPAVEALYRRA